MAVVTWNDQRFRATAEALMDAKNMTGAQFVNQIALDVASDAFDQISPRGDGNAVQEKRSEIKQLMDRQLLTRVKLFKSGKRAGQFGRVGGRNRQLFAKNLIANYWRGKQGKKGLYGKDMTRYAGKMSQSRQVGVGSVKSVFLPIFRALLPVVKFKFSFTRKAGRISVWPGSRGSGTAKIAKPSDNPTSVLTIRYNARFNQDAKLQRVYDLAVGNAIHSKQERMQSDLEKLMQTIIAAFNRGQR